LNNDVEQWIPSIAIASAIPSTPTAIGHEHILTVDQVTRTSSLRIIGDISCVHTYPYSTVGKSVTRWKDVPKRNL